MTKKIAHKIAQLFKPDGLFASRIDNYEYREQQVEMLTAIYEAFANEETVLIEAGTGTGKSLAYLVPAIIWAKEKKQRIIISTNTKNLQEQLFRKEIPFLLANLPFGFSATILKGRANYLCWHKLLYNEKYTLMDSARQNIWAHIFLWAQQTQAGAREEFESLFADNSYLWDSVSADSYNCFGRECKYYEQCFVNMARSRAWEADIIVINHSLLLADILTTNKLLPPYEYLIIDEAHNILEEACQAFGFTYSLKKCSKFLSKVYRVNETDNREYGFVVEFARALRQIKKAISAKRKELIKAKIHDIEFSIEKIREYIVEQKILIHSWMLDNAQQNFSLQQSNSIRVTEKTRQNRYWEALVGNISNLVSQFKIILNSLQDIWTDIESMEVVNDGNSFINYYFLIPTFVTELNRIIASLNEIFFSEKEDWAYWMEKIRGKIDVDYQFRSVPLQIDRIIYDNLISKLKSIVITSATITIDNTFSYIKEALGISRLAPEMIRELRLFPPFDYAEQAILCLPNDFVSPDHRFFEKELADFCIEFSCTLRRKTLFLFTSYAQMHAVYLSVKDFLENENINLFAQGIDGTSSSIVERFKTSKSAVLFGTGSLWEGVDLPGDLLSCVVIVKIPFAVPTDPYEEAKSEFMYKNGLNYFYDSSLPRAVIKLKQGAGRLIRNKNDIGALVILDKRVMLKGYGNEIISSLPNFTQYIGEKRDIIREIQEWFKYEDMVTNKKHN